ncbi:MAG TPA: DUF748 domain-containing protein [Lacunisphaera sp.]
MAIWKIRERKKKKWPRRLLIAGIALALFTVGGFFVAPGIVKTQLEKRAGEALGRTVTVGKVRVNPYAVSVTLENLDVRLKDGSGSFLGWDRLYVNLDPLASILGAWTVGEIELEGFHATAQLLADGRFNFSDILARLNAPAAAPAAPAKPGRPLHIGSLKVARARVDFADQSRSQPFTTTLGPLSFGLTDFRTAGAGARGAPYQFEAVTEAGERLSWTGTLSADPVSSAGELRLENILLAKYAPYYADLMQADLSEGKLFLRGRYELNLAESGRVMKLIDGALQLRNVKVTERATRESLVELAALDIAGVSADALTRKAVMESFTITGGAVRARREKDGTLNLLALVAPAPAGASAQTTAPATPAAATPAPDFMIGEVALRDCAVEFTDLAAPRPAQLSLAGIQFSLKKVTLAEGAVMPLALAFNWAPQGAVKVDGTVTLKPELKADLKTEAAALAILPLSPYLEQFINARITQGAVSSTGAVQVTMAGAAPAVTFAGGVSVDHLGLVDGVHNEELAGFGSLALNGLKAVTAPQLAISLAEISLTAPYARVLVNKDGTLNLAGLAKVEESLPPGSAADAGLSGSKAPSANTGPLPKIEIGKVLIADGDFTLTDRSLEPNVRMGVNQFGGTIAGLSSENLAKADVDLKAAVDGAGPVTITGQLDPLGAKKFVDLKIDFKNVDLLPLSPYSGKYAGYELARGQLNVDVQAKLDGKQLDANNVITLNQFTFGAPVESPAATKLPVRLGVALLKDLNGQIVIDVPMSGSIDDPSLRIGKVVLRVVVNLLTKAAVSPFALLGSMFGGGGDELAYQEFAPGGSELQAAEIKKLETMVKALTNRPGLSVALEGGYDGPADTHVLRQLKLAALVRGRIWEEQHAINPNIPPPAQLQFTPEASAAMLKKLFDEKFPAGTEFGAPLAQAPATVAAPVGAPKGFIRRVVDLITFGLFESAPAQPATSSAPVVPAAAPVAVPAGPSLEEMIGRLAETMPVDDNDLRALAAARAQRVRDYFLNEGKIAADRLFLTQAKEPKENKGPRVFLSLQ